MFLAWLTHPKGVLIKLSNRKETAMTQSMTQSKQSKGKSRLLHWGRVVVMFLSFGIIFPNVMTEDEDIAK